MSVHSTAKVGPYSVVGPEVIVGPGCVIGSHVVLEGRVEIGDGTRIGHHSVIGSPPQIRGFAGEAGKVVIGANSWIREFVTIHAARAGEETVLGDDCLLMCFAHVAHDCKLGHRVELANGVQLAGHVELGDGAGAGGLAAVHQFVKVGAGAFLAAGARVSQDVMPYCLAAGDRAKILGLNRVGLRRRGMAPERIRELQRAVRIIYRARTPEEGIARLEGDEELVAFVEGSTRGLCRWGGKLPVEGV